MSFDLFSFVGNYTQARWHGRKGFVDLTAGLSVNRLYGLPVEHTLYSGSFEVREIELVGNQVSLAIDFVQFAWTELSGDEPDSIKEDFESVVIGQLRVNSSVPIYLNHCGDIDCVVSPWSEWNSDPSCICSPTERITCTDNRTRAVILQPNANGKQCGPLTESRQRILPLCIAPNTRELVPTIFTYKMDPVYDRKRRRVAQRCLVTREYIVPLVSQRGVQVFAGEWEINFSDKPLDRASRYPKLAIGMASSLVLICFLSHLRKLFRCD